MILLFELRQNQIRQIEGYLDVIYEHIGKCLKFKIQDYEVHKHLNTIKDFTSKIIKILNSETSKKANFDFENYKPNFNLVRNIKYVEQRTALDDESLKYFCNYYYNEIIKNVIKHKQITYLNKILKEIETFSKEIRNV